MDEKILRETFDHNLNESFRLKQLENRHKQGLSQCRR